MKKFIQLFIIIITSASIANAQQTKAPGDEYNVTGPEVSPRILYTGKPYTERWFKDDKDYNFYKQRARTQRTIGLSLLGVGLLTGAGGLLAATKEVNGNDYAAQDRADRTAATLFVISAVTGIASIPFMIVASASNHKAKLMLKNEKTGLGVPSNVGKEYAALSMTIPIGK
jgi:hypothetical protein